MPGSDKEAAGGLFGRVTGKSKEIAGSLVGNEDLKEEGRLQQRKVQADADAAKADSEAQQREAEAELAIKQDELDVERQRLDIEAAKEGAEERIEQDRHAELINVEVETRQQRAVSQRQKVVQETSLDQAEGAALRQHQIEVAEAAQTGREAIEARRAAEKLDDAVHRSH